MKKTATLVSIAGQKGPSALSKAQKQFNTLIKRIDKERKRLAEWQEMMPRYQQKHAAELSPLLQSFNAQRVAMAHLLDRAHQEKIFTKTERAKLSDMICQIAGELIMEPESDDVLKQLYNKHSGGDFDAEMEQEGAAVKDMMEAMFGIDLGEAEIDLRSPEAMMAHLNARLHEQQTQQSERAQAGPPPRQRKKSARTLAREAQQQQEQQNVSQSIREVFRKLASALHPDKEQDGEERARKTALMQRANVAYGNNDLLGLLELQLEVEQIDQAAINTVSEDRLKHYNKVLAEQAAEIAHEVAATEMGFALRFKLEPEAAASPLAAMRNLERAIKDLRGGIISIESDLAAFQDSKVLKQALKAYRIAPPDADWF